MYCTAKSTMKIFFNVYNKETYKLSTCKSVSPLELFNLFISVYVCVYVCVWNIDIKHAGIFSCTIQFPRNYKLYKLVSNSHYKNFLYSIDIQYNGYNCLWKKNNASINHLKNCRSENNKNVEVKITQKNFFLCRVKKRYKFPWS